MTQYITDTNKFINQQREIMAKSREELHILNKEILDLKGYLLSLETKKMEIIHQTQSIENSISESLVSLQLHIAMRS